MQNKITVTILTKNSSKHITQCLESVQNFDEVIILDNGSTDNTLEIAEKFQNVKIYKSEFIGFGPLKNLASSHASNDWIFNLDSDEIVSKALSEEICDVFLDEKSIYSIKRDNYYNKKLIMCCGWENDYVLRIFNKNTTRFQNQQVHESLDKNTMQIIKLKNSIKHYPYENSGQLINKMQYYSSLYAMQNTNKKSSPLKAFFRATFSFFRSYILKKGFLCGYEGLLISVTNANNVFYKYVKLYEESLKIEEKL